MPNLLDIAPSNKVVSVSFGDVEVPGLSILGMASILKAHPQLIAIIQKGEVDLDLNVLIDLGSDVSASFFAAGLGYPGNPEAEERCRNLNPEDALDLGQAIFEVSFPKGAKSFLEKITKAVNAVTQQARTMDMNSLNNSLNPAKGS